MGDLISRQAAIDAECEVCGVAPKKERGHNCTYYVHGCEEIECLRALPSAQPTLYGYNVEHLVLIANTMKEKGISPEEAIDLFNDVSEIVGLVIDEMTRISEKALERAMGNDV